ncbi:MAG: succinate dehydrogenase assembly factor 2 [Rhodobacteraceae bacterium]|jgi:antitoxin CptB|nr:succinate dehydrogenase assembly factor 2 [Paracoccaceae bacterium]
MAGTQTAETETREVRLKRLRIRSWRRGIREMDLILGRFAETGMADLSAADLDQYEALLEENDHDLYAWVAGRADVPARHAAILSRIAEGAAG